MVPLHAATLLLSALLLFWVQLLYGRMLLPPFGGTPAVWASCLFFYQAALLAGYGWAHAVSRLPVRAQPPAHLAALGAAALLLPVGVPAGWEPSIAHPIAELLWRLTTRLGPPLVLVSASAPLLQSWYARLGRPDSADPYPLYAASNAGSILALIAYPALAEPLVGIADQARLWAFGYGALAVAIAASGIALWRSGGAIAAAAPGASAEDGGPAPTASATAPTVRERVHWLCLSFVPAALLYGVTGVVTTDIAPAPLLWVVPLGLYLLSWVAAFGRRRLVPRHVVAAALPPLLYAMVLSALIGWYHPAGIVLGAHLLGFFCVCWLLHRDLAARRPPATHLFGFYIAIAAGGLAAGLHGGIAAPVVYTGPLEYPVMLAIALLLVPANEADAAGARWVARTSGLALTLLLSTSLAGFDGRGLAGNLPGALLVAPLLVGIAWTFRWGRWRAVGGIAFAILIAQSTLGPPVVHRERSFFGVHRVARSREGTFFHYLSGTTEHGRQRIDAAGRRDALAYYFPTAPIGQTFAALNARARPPERVAVLGLGIGGLAAWAREGQTWRFYEIDPAVEAIARDARWFTYLRDAPATVEVTIGDARLSLRAEARAEAPRHDVIVLDAFTSDAVPVHLLTAEALALYESRLAEGGVIVVNVSNRFLDLEVVVAAHARAMGLAGIAQRQARITETERAAGKARSHACVLARSTADLVDIAGSGSWRPLDPDPGVRPWTDDRAAILPILRLR